jgi:hypothetical protein
LLTDDLVPTLSIGAKPIRWIMRSGFGENARKSGLLLRRVVILNGVIG